MSRKKTDVCKILVFLHIVITTEKIPIYFTIEAGVMSAKWWNRSFLLSSSLRTAVLTMCYRQEWPYGQKYNFTRNKFKKKCAKPMRQ